MRPLRDDVADLGGRGRVNGRERGSGSKRKRTGSFSQLVLLLLGDSQRCLRRLNVELGVMDPLRVRKMSCLGRVKLVFGDLERVTRRVDSMDGGEMVCEDEEVNKILSKKEKEDVRS